MYQPGSPEASLQQLHSVVTELFTAVKESLSDQRDNAHECLQRAATILEEVELPPPPAPVGVQRGLAPWQVRRVTAHIEANLDSTIRNDALAAVARLSVFHFTVAFRASMGNSPQQYIIRRRMERAQGLMLTTDASLSDIAAACGLADQAHFTRLFRRMVGESPGAWRRARLNPPT